MRRIEVALAAAMALSLSGCVIPRKPKTVAAAPAPPAPITKPAAPEPVPGPLSVPQTNVDLPKTQTLSQDAIASTEPTEQTPLPAPKTPKPPRSKPTNTSAATRVETPATTATTPPATLPAAPMSPPDQERPHFQEIVPPTELSRLQAEYAKSKSQIQQKLEQIRKRRLNPQQKDVLLQINSFVRQSEQAQKQGEMRTAAALAARALLLATELADAR